MHYSQSPPQYGTQLRDTMGRRGSGVKDDVFGQAYDVKRPKQSSEWMNVGSLSTKQSGDSNLPETLGQVDLLSKNYGGVETAKDKCHLKIIKMVGVQTS